MLGENIYYDSLLRLVNNSTLDFMPDLKCYGKMLETFEDDENNPTLMYVGALTANEIVFAGAKPDEINVSFYLINDYYRMNNNWFWTLTPYFFNTHSDRVFELNNQGIFHYNLVSTSVSFRPSINLLSSTSIARGNGTIDNPYIII